MNYMKYFLWIFSFCTIIISCAVKKEINPSDNLLELWNKKTMTSISEQLSSTNDKFLRKEFKNYLYSAKLFLYGGTTGDDGKEAKSIRAKFLETIFLHNVNPRDFFVLEFMERGELTKVKDVLIINKGNSLQITFFQYSGNKWYVVGDTTIKIIDLHNEIARPYHANGKIDIGLEHVILSEFNGTNIVSRYYPRYLVGKHNAFFGLLDKAMHLP